MSITKSIQFNVINANIVRPFDLWLPQEITHLPSDLIRLLDQRHICGLLIYSLNLLNLFLQSNCLYVNPPYITLVLFHLPNSHGEKIKC